MKRSWLTLLQALCVKLDQGFDLPIALGILAATGQMDAEVVRHALVVGELSLGGGVRCSAGMLAYQRCAAGLGLGTDSWGSR